MKQITEDYVSFEIAQLLKEKGFDGKCRMIYREHDKQMIYHTPNADDLLAFETNKRKLEKHSKKQHCQYLLCPTLQMALKWLRENNLYIEIRRNLNTFYFRWKVEQGAADKAVSEYKYDTYEEAVEAALLYVLKNDLI